MREFAEKLFSNPDMLRMGHHQRLEDHNLGLGEMYYALGRLLRPSLAVVIGSYRGFTPAVIARSLIDNNEGGELVFIDPSYVDDFWVDADKVKQHFRELGTPNVRHYLKTTQDFVRCSAYHEIHDVGLLMIDGMHTAEQARFDYLSFLDKLEEQAVVLFHDTAHRRISRIYGEDKPYEYSVCDLIERLHRTPGLEVLTLPFGSGVTLVRGRPENLAVINAPF